MNQQSIEVPRRGWLPAVGTPAYYLLLAAVAIFILGPLGGISAAYMNFSLGFFVGGQVLAGILGSAVTYGYGAEGKHGANYMQTMAASVAGMSAMGVLLQAMTWLGLPEFPAWQMVTYFTCIGMFGVGVGMFYTPILVDRMQLAYPSGYAVANILRALTDKLLLRRSIRQLGGGIGLGLLGAIGVTRLSSLEALGLSTSTLGAGMVVSARITIPALIVALIGWRLTPYLQSIGWLEPGDPFRKIGFIIGLGMILGAATIDLTLIAIQAVQRLREHREAAPAEDWKRTNSKRLVAWVVFWGVAVVVVATQLLGQPVGLVLLAIGLVFIFLIINGISTGISDSNPISSAFVVAVFLMAAVGLKDAGVGLMCAAILLVSCTVGVDMQQDRSTGWRLGTNRVIQFRYQVLGILMGAVFAVVLARVFMSAYEVLRINQFDQPNAPGTEQWQSAMTYKFVGALQDLTDPKPFVMKALVIGICIGFVIEALRKWVKSRERYQVFASRGRHGAAGDFFVDTVLLPSPYASSFGAFVELLTTIWFTTGGVITTAIQSWPKETKSPMEHGEEMMPTDMSGTSLVGGGLIAGDSLAALGIGILGLMRSVL